MRVITFSTEFPERVATAYRKTHFPEAIWANFPHAQVLEWKMQFDPDGRFFDFMEYERLSDMGLVKSTTIRRGHRWKKGDKFQPRIWTGRPYHSPQLAFMPEIEVLDTEDFAFDGETFFASGVALEWNDLVPISNRDGLSVRMLTEWFGKTPFDGQRIFFNLR